MLVEHNLSQQQQRLTGVNFQQTRLCVRRVVQADFVNSALGRNAAPFQYLSLIHISEPTRRS